MSIRCSNTEANGSLGETLLNRLTGAEPISQLGVQVENGKESQCRNL